MPELIPIANATRMARPPETRCQSAVGQAWPTITTPGHDLTAVVVHHAAIGDRG